jgi:hypothetical protein
MSAVGETSKLLRNLLKKNDCLIAGIEGQLFVAFHDKATNNCGEKTGLPLCHRDERRVLENTTYEHKKTGCIFIPSTGNTLFVFVGRLQNLGPHPLP